MNLVSNSGDARRFAHSSSATAILLIAMWLCAFLCLPWLLLVVGVERASEFLLAGKALLLFVVPPVVVIFCWGKVGPQLRAFNLNLGTSVYLASMLALGYLSSSIFFVNGPQFGWDALDYWFPRTIALQQDFFLVFGQGKHPDTIPATLLPLSEFLTPTLKSLPILLLFASIYLVSPFTPAMRLLTALTVSFCMPLIQNHLSIIGYAEIWVAIVVVLAIVVGSISYFRPMAIIVFISLIATLTLLKDTSVLYSGLILGAWLASAHRVSFGVSLLTLIVAILYPAALIGNLAGCLPEYIMELCVQPDRISVGRKSFPIYINDLSAIFRNIGHSLFVNSSFASFPLTGTVIVFAVARDFWTGPAGRFLVLSPLFCFCVIIFMQLVTRRYYFHSLPDSDTSLSRFTLVPLLASTPLVIHGLALCVERCRAFEESRIA